MVDSEFAEGDDEDQRPSLPDFGRVPRGGLASLRGVRYCAIMCHKERCT